MARSNEHGVTRKLTKLRKALDPAKRLGRYLELCELHKLHDAWDCTAPGRWAAHFSPAELEGLDQDIHQVIKAKASKVAVGKSTQARLNALLHSPWKLRAYDVLRDLGEDVFKDWFLRRLLNLATDGLVHRQSAVALDWHTALAAMYAASRHRRAQPGKGVSKTESWQTTDIRLARAQLAEGLDSTYVYGTPHAANTKRKTAATKKSYEGDDEHAAPDLQDGSDAPVSENGSMTPSPQRKRRRISARDKTFNSRSPELEATSLIGGDTYNSDIDTQYDEEDRSDSGNSAFRLHRIRTNEPSDIPLEEATADIMKAGEEYSTQNLHTTFSAASESDWTEQSPTRSDLKSSPSVEHGRNDRREASLDEHRSPFHLDFPPQAQSSPLPMQRDSTVHSPQLYILDQPVDLESVHMQTPRLPSRCNTCLSMTPPHPRSKDRRQARLSKIPGRTANRVVAGAACMITTHNRDASAHTMPEGHDADQRDPISNNSQTRSCALNMPQSPGPTSTSGESSRQAHSASIMEMPVMKMAERVRPSQVSKLLGVATSAQQQIPPTTDDGARETLQPGRWLSATALCAVMKCFNPSQEEHHVLESGALHLEDADHAEAAGQRAQTRCNQSIFYIPVNVRGSHWLLCSLDRRRGQLEVYDPLTTDHNHTRLVETQLQRYASRLHTLSDGDSSPLAWNLVAQPLLKQQNAHDCGIYVAARAVFKMHDIACPQSIIPEVWRRAFAVCLGSLDPGQLED
ncbi:putative Ulp1 protease family catalytic domain, papain-like cysteine peptidase superfamily [Septoria linicola]|nr:putative Ulp1 protease family catalytic domain, papain-like cysteine peptidase superfamily [Septoria linicola]